MEPSTPPRMREVGVLPTPPLRLATSTLTARDQVAWRITRSSPWRRATSAFAAASSAPGPILKTPPVMLFMKPRKPVRATAGPRGARWPVCSGKRVRALVAASARGVRMA